MESGLVRCLMTAGMFRPRLSRDERERFKSLIESGSHFAGSTPSIVLKGENSHVYCFFPQAEAKSACEETGSNCFVIYTGEKKSFQKRASPVEQHTNRFERSLFMMNKLNSSWATVVVNDKQRIVSLTRDRAGAYSMYYAVADGILYFASSLTYFRRFSFPINMSAVSDFLHFLYVPAPKTIYEGVNSVLPGQAVSYNGEIINEEKIPIDNSIKSDFSEEIDIPDDQYLYSFEEHLIKSLSQVCPKDKKSALFLSGGKDSSALAVAIRMGELENVEAITVGFDDKRIDESDDASIVARHLGLPLQILRFSPSQYLKYWPEFINSLGQPMGDPAAMPVYVVMKELADSYDVYLDGTGNDSYMGITTTWHEDFVWFLYRVNPWLYHMPWKHLMGGFSYTLDMLKHAFGKPREEQFVSWQGWAEDEIYKLTGRNPDWTSTRLYRMFPAVPSAMVHKTLTLCDIWEPETAYRKTVQIASVLGKTVHFPYLDRDLIRYCESLPAVFRHDDKTNKVIIRLLLKKYLPPEILNKKKGAFNFPKSCFLKTDNYQYIRNLLSGDVISKHNVADPLVVNSYVERYINGEDRLEDRIWALVLLYSWLEFGRA